MMILVAEFCPSGRLKMCWLIKVVVKWTMINTVHLFMQRLRFSATTCSVSNTFGGIVSSPYRFIASRPFRQDYGNSPFGCPASRRWFLLRTSRRRLTFHAHGVDETRFSRICHVVEQALKRVFFVYNHIDILYPTTDGRMIDVVKTLGECLNESFNLVQHLGGSADIPDGT